MSLCYRCEHRAKNKETCGKYQPRYECGTDDSVGSCYMFQPVRPIAIKANKGDDRPIAAGWALSARCHPVVFDENILKLNIEVVDEKDGKFIMFWNLKK